MSHTRTCQRLLDALTELGPRLDACFELSPPLRASRPAPAVWSIDEILEHLWLADHYLLLVIEKHANRALRAAARGAPIPAGESDLERLEPIGRPGAFPWSCPEHMRPTGQKGSEELHAALREQLERCRRLVGDLGHGVGALRRVRLDVAELGHLDLYQWLQFLLQHLRRHLAQIEARREPLVPD